MFDAVSVDTGLETVLAKWGIRVVNAIVKDPDYTTSGGLDVVVQHFSDHPAVNPLTGSRLQMVMPHEVSKFNGDTTSADGMKVEEIAFTGPNSYLENGGADQKRRAYSIMVAAEKGTVKGVVKERGTTRILAVGDSIFLGNLLIDSGANRDFAGYAANWLLERSLLLNGLGPHPVTEYHLLMTSSQAQAVQWILLAAMPGGVLMIGGLVWLRRRR